MICDNKQCQQFPSRHHNHYHYCTSADNRVRLFLYVRFGGIHYTWLGELLQKSIPKSVNCPIPNHFSRKEAIRIDYSLKRSVICPFQQNNEPKTEERHIYNHTPITTASPFPPTAVSFLSRTNRFLFDHRGNPQAYP